MSEISGPVKLKDGVFFGDSFAANDIEFVAANKVSKIVNCAGREVLNHFESVGVEYLSFNWMDNDAQVIIDSRSNVVNSVSDFIDGALEKGESVLIHSVRGKSRCVTILAAYLMKKFKWKLNKALQFLQSRRSDVAIKAAFHRQLISFERRLALSVDLSSNWDIPPPSNGSCSMDHLIMFNTYINSQVGAKAQAVFNNSKTQSTCSSLDSKKKIAWRDNFQDIRSQLEQESNSSGKTFCYGVGGGPLKSILKQPHEKFVPSPAAASTAPSTPCFRSTFSSTGGGPVRVGRTLMTAMTTNNTSSAAATVALRTPITNHHVRPPSPMVSRSSPMVSVGRKQSETSSVLRQPSPSSSSSQTRHAASPSLLSGGSMGIRLSSPSITNFSSSLRQASPSASMSASLRPPSPANKRDLFVRPIAHSQDLVLARNRTNFLAGQVVRRAPSPMTAALQGPLRPMTAPVWRAR